MRRNNETAVGPCICQLFDAGNNQDKPFIEGKIGFNYDQSIQSKSSYKHLNLVLSSVVSEPVGQLNTQQIPFPGHIMCE